MVWHALLGGAVLLVIVVGPLAYALAAARHRDPVRPQAALATSGWPWRLVVGSALQCVTAFNLVFLTQEILLVAPKALTPGLRPTLFHNNHTWQGTAPIADLFQGTGAVGLLVMSCWFAVAAKRRQPRSVLGRLLLIWIGYQAMFQALPQFVVAGLREGDLSQAMDYLAVAPAVRTGLAFVALAAVPVAAMHFTRLFLGLAADVADVETGPARRRFMLRVAVVPALLAIPLIVPFRVPREPTEVLLPPLIASGVGSAWMIAAAQQLMEQPAPAVPFGSLASAATSCVALLLLFQLVLRPGIPFF